LRENKGFLCEKPPIDVENNMSKDYCEQVVEEKVFMVSIKEEQKQVI